MKKIPNFLDDFKAAAMLEALRGDKTVLSPTLCIFSKNPNI